MSPQSLLDRLASQFPTAKRQNLRKMIADRRVRVNGLRATRATQEVAGEDKVEVLDRAAAAPAVDSSRLIAPLKIVYEDDDVLVVDKPPGLLTSTVSREKRPTALAIVRAYVEATSPRARVGLIHRLDRDASGLLVFSKTNNAYDLLKTQFFKHAVERVYEATVHGNPSPPAGTIESFLVERTDGSVHSTKQHGKGQRAVTEYEVVHRDGKQSVLRVRLQTGRKHQIRAHLSERGWAIVGDPLYGPTDTKGPGGLMLRAVRLAFDHPRTGQRVSFDAL
jgi:23S rRNA pseudouridine1911/1915/1917 synthase